MHEHLRNLHRHTLRGHEFDPVTSGSEAHMRSSAMPAARVRSAALHAAALHAARVRSHAVHVCAAAHNQVQTDLELLSADRMRSVSISTRRQDASHDAAPESGKFACAASHGRYGRPTVRVALPIILRFAQHAYWPAQHECFRLQGEWFALRGLLVGNGSTETGRCMSPESVSEWI